MLPSTQSILLTSGRPWQGLCDLVLCLHGAVDNVEMGEEELFQNTHLSSNFLVSLLKKHKKHIEKFTKTD